MLKKIFQFSLLVILLSRDVKAQWTSNTALNTAISIFTGDKYRPEIINDGSDGAIISWQDTRNGGYDYRIYAQRINASGIPQWAANGVVICDTLGIQVNPHLISDGAGGAIIAWVDARVNGYEIYAQKINSLGVIQWNQNGVAVCKAAEDQSLNIFDRKSIISDGAGGAIIAWDDYRNSPNRDIYCQKISSSGVIQWLANGVAVCTTNVSQSSSNCAIASDSLGGAIVTWQDSRNGSGNTDVYAQRINATGAVQWATNGVVISSAANVQIWPNIVSDNSNGAIVTWLDARNSILEVYAQKINSFGVVQWLTNGVGVGVGVSDVGTTQYYPNLISDGSNGAIITWHDRRSGVFGIYAQKINSSGTIQWTSNGNLVATGANDRLHPSIIADGASGAYISWIDRRNSNDYDIYVQRINSSGLSQWQTNGIALSTAANDQQYPKLVKTGQGVICSWADKRSGNYDIYAQNIDDNGLIGVGINELFENNEDVLFYPNPNNGVLYFKSSSITQIIIYNTLGYEVMRINNNSNDDMVDISHIGNGVYFLEINQNKKIKRYKLIKV